MSGREQQKPSTLKNNEPVVRALVIGDLPRWQAEGRDIAGSDELSFVSLPELTKNVLDDKSPGIILSPLVADSFDALDVAARLAELDFQGKYRVLSGPAADTSMIKAEVQAIAPNLDFDILSIK